MTLASWQMANFKSVVRSNVRLTPLTVLLGPNSAGKSSLIQSILLFAQAQATYAGSSALSLNGPLVKLGTYDEVRTRFGNPDYGISLGGELRVSGAGRQSRGTGPSSINWEIDFVVAGPETPGEMVVSSMDLAVDDVASVSLHRIDQRVSESRGFRADNVVSVAPFPGARGLERTDVFLDDLVGYEGDLWLDGGASSPPLQLPVSGGSCLAGFPSAALVHSESVPEGLLSLGRIINQSWSGMRMRRPSRGRLIRERGESSDPVTIAMGLIDQSWPDIERRANFLSEMRGDVPDSLVPEFEVRRLAADLIELAEEQADPDAFERSLIEAWRRRDPQPQLAFEALFPGALGWGADTARNYFASRVQYLGPVRTVPRTTSAEAQYSRGVGAEGEITAAVLHGARAARVQYVSPQSFDDGTNETVESTLGDAVDDWMRALELADAVSTRDLGRYGIEVTVRPRGLDAEVNQRNVGVGVSQVLPLVVLCLRSGPGSLILVEQPELHLHPGAQQRLADFLVAMMRSGRQLIVETHSDHMVTRLRRRIAEDETDLLKDDVSFVYVTQSAESGGTSYAEAASNSYGGFEDWPQGFFAQGADEAAALLGAALAKKERRGGQG